MSKLIWSIWLLLLNGLTALALPTGIAQIPVCSVHCPQPIVALSFDYDKGIQRHIDYDGSSAGTFDYDGAVVRAANECASQSAGSRALIATSVEFLAAEGELPANIASTFSGGQYTSTVLQADMIAYRYSGGISQPAGSFLTTADTVSQISSPVSASVALNLPAGATAQTLNTFTIPAGTRIFTGGVSGGASSATQIYIQNPSVLIPH